MEQINLDMKLEWLCQNDYVFKETSTKSAGQILHNHKSRSSEKRDLFHSTEAMSWSYVELHGNHSKSCENRTMDDIANIILWWVPERFFWGRKHLSVTYLAYKNTVQYENKTEHAAFS